jgi:cyanophycin synthetase
MYHLNATRILYQTSKYAPTGVLQLDITVPAETADRQQISESLDQLDSNGFTGLLSPAGEASAASVYCDLVLGLQRSVGHAVQYCRVEDTDNADEYRVFIEYEEEASSLYAAETAIQLLNDVLQQRDMSHSRLRLREFEAYARPRLLDSNARLLIQAARRKSIPVLRPLLPTSLSATAAEVNNDEFLAGWGIHQQRCNGAISEKLVSMALLSQLSDRARLYPVLINAGMPLPGQDLEFLNRNQSRRAQRSAQRIGYPVVLRPRAIRVFQYRFAEDYVFGPLHTDEQVALAARHLADNCGLDVWVESYVSGDQYRLLVLNGEVLSVLRCHPPVITGDGVQSIAQLSGPLIDEDVLVRIELAGHDPDSVLACSEQLAVRACGTLNNGGRCEDVSGEIPARFRELAVEVAQRCGLDALAGVELVIDDLSGVAKTPNCVVTNVVADPDLELFAQLSDQPERIGDGYMAALFPPGAPSRIPIVSVTGTNGKTTTCRMVKHILMTAGLKTGLACTDGVYLDDEWINTKDSSGVPGALDLFTRAELEAAVLETARGGLAHTGIAYDHCDVGACTNIAAEHLGDEGIETMDDMAAHKGQVIERTSGTAVLNAEDPRCLAMRDKTAAGEVVLVASSTTHPAVQSHCKAGGKAIAVDDSKAEPVVVMLAPGGGVTPILAVRDIPAAYGGAAQYNVMNAMFATAIGMGLGIDRGTIVSSLKTFRMNVENTPGRLNEVSGFPFRVIVDAAHNAHGLRALVRYIDQLPVEGRKIINYGTSGEMKNEAIEALNQQAAGHFDLYVVRNYFIDFDLILKFRPYEEIPELLRNDLMRWGVPEEKIIVEPDLINSLDKTLKVAQKGDLLLVLVRVGAVEKFEVIKKLEKAAKFSAC